MAGLGARHKIGYGRFARDLMKSPGTIPPASRRICEFIPPGCYELPDLGEALGKIEGLGGTKVMGPVEVVPGGPSIALFADPRGHLAGLFKP